MVIFRIFLAAGLASLAAAPAIAEDWRLTSVRPTNYGRTVAFVDAQSIRGQHGQVQFSGMTYFSRHTRKMNRLAVTIHADCQSLMFRFEQITSYRNQQPIGQWHSTAAIAAKPSTNVFDEISMACGLSELGMHVSSPESFAATHFKTSTRHRMRRF